MDYPKCGDVGFRKNKWVEIIILLIVEKLKNTYSKVTNVIYFFQSQRHFTDDAEPRRRIRREQCIPTPCNMWGTYAPISQCDALCGGGSQRIQRNCSCRGNKYSS